MSLDRSAAWKKRRRKRKLIIPRKKNQVSTVGSLDRAAKVLRPDGWTVTLVEKIKRQDVKSASLVVRETEKKDLDLHPVDQPLQTVELLVRERSGAKRSEFFHQALERI
jgi:hypothetical protein